MLTPAFIAHGGMVGAAIELALVVLLTAVLVAVVVKERRRARSDGEEPAASEE